MMTQWPILFSLSLSSAAPADDADAKTATDSVIEGTAKRESEYSEIHWSEVKTLKSPPITYPKEAILLDLSGALCHVLFRIDEKGKTDSVAIIKKLNGRQLHGDCPKVFHESIEEAGMKWTFKPVKDASGKPMKAMFRQQIKFKLK